MSAFNPTTLAIAAALSIPILAALLGWRSRRKKKRAAEAAKKAKANGYTIILLRGSGPVGGILSGCVFANGRYVIDPKGRNPIYVPFDGRFIKQNATGGEPFMHFDMESQSLINYTGAAVNDDEVTVVHHDGVVEDMAADKAKALPQSDEPVEGKVTVFRKHAGLWRRWPGSRIYSELTTNDWNNIQYSSPSWLVLLQQYGMPILIVITLVLVVIGIAGLF